MQQTKVTVKEHGLDEFLKKYHVPVKNQRERDMDGFRTSHVLSSGVLYLKKECGLIKGEIIMFEIEDVTQSMGVKINVTTFYEAANYDEMLICIVKVHSESQII